MKERATDVVAMLPQIEMVKNSKLLSAEDKAVCLRELATSLPPEMLCSGFPGVRRIVEQVIDREVANAQPKKAEKKIPAKASEKAPKRNKK